MSTTSTSTLPTLPNLHTITSRPSHDRVLAQAQNPSSPQTGVPTLIYVSSSSSPQCQKALPRVIELAEANPHVQVYVMELTPETAPMIKFGPQNTPIFIGVQGMWCQTVLGLDWRGVEGLVARFERVPEDGKVESG